MPGTDRLSNSSFEDASPPQPRQILPDGSELIPTRTIATTAPKPAANPLQFIKVGPCDLYKAAQEQLKKVEEIKKVEKTVKEESEDWQSNLDHWKCSRRKRQEHIIDRVVEVKKLELEEHERNKRRGKTLSEMIQERSEKGVGPRKMSLMTYPDEDPSDLTDLGISLDKSNAEMQENQEIADSEALPDARSSEDSSKVPCPDVEEYTYERAIQGYKSFAEKSVKASLKPRVSPPKPGGRIGEKLQELEQVRLRSNSVSDVDLPKVDIHKRRSLFEVVESAETKSPSAERIAKDLAGASIVKQRLSSLEKQPELPPTPVTRLVDDIGPALKDRLSTLESTKHEPPRRIVNEEVTCVSIKERLSSLENGCKESVVSNFSDEELGHKEIPSPAASDREVSSPLVSQALFNNEVNVMAPSINVEGRTNVLVEGTSELVVGDGSPCDNDIHETAPLLGSACKNETEEDNRPEEISPVVCQTTAESSDVACAENCITELKSLKTDKCQNQSASNSVDHVALQHIDQSNESKLGTRTTDEKGPKPCVRARKLTPFLTQPASPSISQKDRLVIGEDKPFGVQELLVIAEDEDEDIHPSLTPRTGAMAQGPETSESGIDMEESSLYTDENIDEVLGEDDYEINGDAHDVPDSASDLHRMRQKPRHTEDAPLASHEAVTRFDQPQENIPANLHDTKDVDSNKESESVARLDELIAPVKSDKLEEAEEIHRLRQDLLSSEQSAISGQSSEVIVKSKEPIVNYENSMIVNQVVDLSRSNEVVMFPLSPTSCVEPPKEKPPPPPVDVSDADDNEDIVEAEAPPIPPKASVRRIDSTKRLKKEIRKKRSDFLGIEGVNDDVVLEPEVAPPPDMLALLEEERRLDQQLYRQSLSSDADSMEGTNIFMQNTAIAPGKPLYSGQELYRESICAETDANHEATESRDSGVELDRSNGEECWNNSPQPQLQPHQHSQIYANIARHAGDSEMVKREAEIIETLEKEENSRYVKSAPDDTVLKEALSEKLKLLEEEKLRLEWVRAEEEGRRMADEERLEAKEILLRQQANLDPTNLPTDSQENLRAERERLEQEQLELIRVRQDLLTQQQHPAAHGPMGTNLRYSMPNLQDSPPPPQTPRQFSSWSRIPSADNLVDHPPRHPQQIQQQQMTRTTLHALSATPRSRIVNGEAWMQPKRKADSTKGSYNYRHWLIQEAEHRRITEQQQRTVQSRRSLPAGHSASPRVPSDYSPVHVAPPPSHHHPHGAGVPWPSQHNVVGLPPAPHNHTAPHQPSNKPLPDAIIQTLTQRVQSKTSPKRRVEERPSPSKPGSGDTSYLNGEQERMLSVSGKKKCSHCGDELGRGAAMVIESLRLFYHIDCFKCCVCHTQLGDGLMGTDVRVRNNKLHCHNCYSSDDGVKFSCV